MKRYEVSPEVSEDNEMNSAILHANITDRLNTERQIEEAKRGKVAHDVEALLRFKKGVDKEIAAQEQLSGDFYARHRDELHGEAFNMAGDEGAHITHIPIEQPQTEAEIIPLRRVAASGYIPGDRMAVAAQR